MASSSRRHVNDVFLGRRGFSRLRRLASGMRVVARTKGHDTTCLILTSHAKLSHPNSSPVRVAVLVSGRGGRRRGRRAGMTRSRGSERD